MLKAVLDTNVLISASEDAFSYAHQTLEAALSQSIQVFSSKPIRDEYRLLLNQKRGREEKQKLERLFEVLTDVRTRRSGLRVEADSEDQKFVDCAETAQADYLVTEDNHLLDLEKFGTTRIVTPKQFMNLFGEYQDPDGKKEWSDWTKMILGNN